MPFSSVRLTCTCPSPLSTSSSPCFFFFAFFLSCSPYHFDQHRLRCPLSWTSYALEYTGERLPFRWARRKRAERSRRVLEIMHGPVQGEGTSSFCVKLQTFVRVRGTVVNVCNLGYGGAFQVTFFSFLFCWCTTYMPGTRLTRGSLVLDFSFVFSKIDASFRI